MGSLTGCLKRAGSRLDSADIDLIKSVTRDYERDGIPHSEAARKAIDEAIGFVDAERTELVAQIEAKGGVVPQRVEPAVEPAAAPAAPTAEQAQQGEVRPPNEPQEAPVAPEAAQKPEPIPSAREDGDRSA